MSIIIPKRTFMTIIRQSEIAYRQFLGMERTKLNPGIHIKIPILHKIDRIDTREQYININILNTFTYDNVPMSITGSLFFKVNDPEKALFSVSDYTHAVNNLGQLSIRSEICKFTYDKIMSQHNDINNKLANAIDKNINTLGVSCDRFKITNFELQTTNKDIIACLEKQMQEGRNQKINNFNKQILLWSLNFLVLNMNTMFIGIYLSDISRKL